MAKVKITPILSVNEADEFFYFVVDFYACQQCKYSKIKKKQHPDPIRSRVCFENMMDSFIVYL